MHRRIRAFPDDCDVLIHAGDITNSGELNQLDDFLEWIEPLPFKHKVVVAGNHDFSLDLKHPRMPKRNFFKRECAERGIHYLEGEGVTLDGVRFWGGPWTPNLPGWAFPETRGCWDAIPNDTQVLVTHGPCFNIGDLVGVDHQVQVGLGTHVGSTALERAIDFVQTRGKILAHVCGHIHESYSVRFRRGITCVVASTCTRKYEPTNLPIVIDVEP